MPGDDLLPEPGAARSRGGSGALIVIVAAAIFLVLAGWIAVSGATRAASPSAEASSSAPPEAPRALVIPQQGLPDTADGGATSTGTDAATAGQGVGAVARVDPAWAAATAGSTGIPQRVLIAYAGAELVLATEAPGCGIRWNTLAGIGRIESGHGTHDGSAVGADGVTRPGIFGIDLTGEASARIDDTDGGAWDGTARIDRAVGPMQFIPATWQTWGADGNGDGVRDPQQIDDAALAAARYLCHSGSLAGVDGWRRAVFSYNHLDSYVDAVAVAANEYAELAAR